ncbi:lipoyl(octanoyl) transferase LipB [Aliamphritea hakodatensis]|uniref:lipoyl(octanoyl) transferase LipB n=1 Tax=Aliamphritea hakodatensis TaxID=2895352 RepID=UPI0022FD7256|nr:lipoyl(octanoyl) transferase LipB [Aliamphritea hakodatensis]
MAETTVAEAEQQDASPQALMIRELGQQEYMTTWQAMQDFTAGRTAATVDEVWLLEHSPVYTQGHAGKAEHVLNPGDIPVIPVDRGGQVTYHGPGQLVVYMLLNIRRKKFGVRELVARMEASVIELLAQRGIEAYARKDAPGVYVGDAKIAALGLRVRRGCSFHGLAFNIDMDLAPFDRINPCGYAGMAVTSLARLQPVADPAAVHREFLDILLAKLDYQQLSHATTIN